MNKFVAAFFVAILSLGFHVVAVAGYGESHEHDEHHGHHEHHEHHPSKESHEGHVKTIREAVEVLNETHPELAKQLEAVAEHHEHL